MSWYLKVIRQYFDFEGRARRKEYWMFVPIFNFVLMFFDRTPGANRFGADPKASKRALR